MVSTKQEQSIRSVRIDLVAHKDITAENRLDPLPSGRLIELNESEEIGKVRQRQCWHAVLSSTQHRRAIVVLSDIKTNGPIGDGVFAVQAEMDKA